MKNWYKGSYYMLYNIISKQENVPNYSFLTNCQKNVTYQGLGCYP